MANEEHLKILIEGEVEGWNEFRATRSTTLDLSNANLSRKDLRAINFLKTNLEGADLSHTDLLRARLDGVNLSNSKLDWANLQWSTMNGTNLSGASLVKANIAETSCQSVKLNGADLTGAKCNNINALSSQMTGVCFDRAILTNAQMNSCNCTDATFLSANLSGAQLSNVKLIGANLTGANLQGAQMNNAVLANASLQNSNFKNANLHSANLRGVDLTTTDLTGAHLSRAIIDPDKVRPGQLSADQRKQLGWPEENTQDGDMSQESKIESEEKKEQSPRQQSDSSEPPSVPSVATGTPDEPEEKMRQSELPKEVCAQLPKGASEKFTVGVWKVLALAYQEAQKMQRGYFGTGHVLIGLLREESDFCAKLLREFDIEVNSVRAMVRELSPRAPEIAGSIYLAASTSFVRAIKYSVKESITLNDDYIGTLHILFGLCMQTENTAYRVLRKLDVDVEDIRKKIGDVLHSDNDERVKQMSESEKDDTPEQQEQGKDVGQDFDIGETLEKVKAEMHQLEMAFRSFLEKKKYPKGLTGGGHRIVDVGEKVSLNLRYIYGDESNILAVVAIFYSKDDDERLSVRNKAMRKLRETAEFENMPAYLVVPAQKNTDYVFDIYEVTDTDKPEPISYDDFPTYHQMLFASPLSEERRRLCWALIRFAKKNYGLISEAPTSDYINLKLGRTGRTAAQIHRFEELETELALVLPGYQKEFSDDKQPSLVRRVNSGEIDFLSGYPKKSSGQKNWLDGNRPDVGINYKAAIYVIDKLASQKNSVWNSIENLLLLAIKNAKGKEPAEPESKAVEAGMVSETVVGKVAVAGVEGNTTTIGVEGVARKDRLGRDKLVKILAGMFVLTDCKNGFTMALLGDWGQGKSTVMGLLQTELEDKHEGEFEFATYNAWEYENTDNIAAGVAQEVVNGLCGELEGKERWKLMKGFVKCEHGEEIKRQLIYICLAIIIIAVGSLIVQSEVLKDICVGGGLVGLLVYMLTKAVQLTEHPLGKKIETYLRLPTYRKHLGLVPVLKRHLRTMCKLRLGGNKKLVVFVDDLDRCNVDHIAKVLDAVRLVMTIPNVIVMIGIDHRIAFKAIRKHYRDLADRNETRGSAEIARDYLGKIIQLPLRLKAATHDELEEYVFEHLFDNENLVDDSEPIVRPKIKDVKEKISGETASGPVAENVDLTDVTDMGRDDSTSDTAEDVGSVPPKAEMTDEEIYEAIKDKKSERDEFYELVGKFGFSNPRQLLRLHNSFRFLKGFDRRYDTRDVLKMLFWQEFLHNWPMAVRDRCMAALIDKVHAEKLGSKERKVLGDVRDDIVKLFNEPESYTELAELVRIVVLPHNEDGVLDTREDIDEWVKKADKEAARIRKKEEGVG